MGWPSAEERVARRSNVSTDLVARMPSAKSSLPGQYRQRLQGQLELSLRREANVIPRARFTCFDHRDWVRYEVRDVLQLPINDSRT